MLDIAELKQRGVCECMYTYTYTHTTLGQAFFLPKIFTNFLAVIHSAEALHYVFTEDRIFLLCL